MGAQQFVEDWFAKWESEDFMSLPLTSDFRHTSPFGTINGKQEYLRLVEGNKNMFLGYNYTLHDSLYDPDKACVRYTITKADFSLDVCEWYYIKHGLIYEVIAYYHIGEVRQERKLRG